ncbi:MAG: SurA N-terminal domain-containing protein [Alphaproteobacteria bacterium]|uniref:SurA N-terminal domain-containing protein n=1 Tax=PS1 clade bacterium TaxID=2175152 RepID=A0A368DPH5_9PROT|nr:hypothetical protein [Rhodobiaceae bacterium]OUT73730.1 MAG: hypothetical protein CBB85_06860 [Rhizobiales bacterium TMED25]RCL73732.1 MAG: hypothetical protein DBW71_02850 [PS1 clade bacterium]|tara:strand:- start:2325 stop:3233 length:909 start_codon:yes stop_codon:yes gene_type:complete
MGIKTIYKNKVIVFAIILFILLTNTVKSQIISKIILLVNGLPIIETDFQERSKYIKFVNPNAERDVISRAALKELVDEAIMKSEAEKIGLSYSDEQIIITLDDTLKAQGASYEEYAGQLTEAGVDPKTIIDQRKSRKLWQDYIGRKYARLANVTLEDIDKYRNSLLERELFHIQTMTLSTENIDPMELMDLVNNIENNFQSCSQNLFSYKDKTNIDIQDRIDISIDQIEEPFNTMIRYNLNTFLFPPQADTEQIKIYINCTPKKSLTNKVIENILIADQLDNYSTKILRDIIQDSNIEYKNK